MFTWCRSVCPKKNEIKLNGAIKTFSIGFKHLLMNQSSINWIDVNLGLINMWNNLKHLWCFSEINLRWQKINFAHTKLKFALNPSSPDTIAFQLIFFSNQFYCQWNTITFTMSSSSSSAPSLDINVVIRWLQ